MIDIFCKYCKLPTSLTELQAHIICLIEIKNYIQPKPSIRELIANEFFESYSVQGFNIYRIRRGTHTFAVLEDPKEFVTFGDYVTSSIEKGYLRKLDSNPLAIEKEYSGICLEASDENGIFVMVCEKGILA